MNELERKMMIDEATRALDRLVASRMLEAWPGLLWDVVKVNRHLKETFREEPAR